MKKIERVLGDLFWGIIYALIGFGVVCTFAWGLLELFGYKVEIRF